LAYADRPLTTQLTVKRDFVHSEIGARADLRMDKVELVCDLKNARVEEMGLLLHSLRVTKSCGRFALTA
jgi:hypothetical protein